MKLHDENVNLLRVIHVPRTKHIGPMEAGVETARQLQKRFPTGKFSLMLSGGIDSQAMLNSWLYSNVPFEAYHVNYPNGLNDHDREALELADQYNVKVTEISFDPLRFYETLYPSYVERFRCGSPQICVHMAFSKLVPNIKVFSGTPPLSGFLGFDNTIYGLARYAEFSGDSVIPFFFTSTAEIINSFNDIDHITDVENAYAMKIIALRRWGFDIIPQKTKQTGFEKIKEIYEDLYGSGITSLDRMKYSKHFSSNRAYDILLRYPFLFKLNNHYTPTVIYDKADSD